MKFLNPRLHGYADYLVVALFLLGPFLMGMSGLPAYLCYALAGVHLLVTLLTDFPLGVAKVIPMKLHGMIELIVAPSLMALPWILSFSDNRSALLFFSGFGALIFLAWLFTDYGAAAPSKMLQVNQEPMRKSA